MIIMKKLIKPNVIDLGKALKDMPIGGELEIPHHVARESQVRQRCTRLKEKGYLYRARVKGADMMVVTRLR